MYQIRSMASVACPTVTFPQVRRPTVGFAGLPAVTMEVPVMGPTGIMLSIRVPERAQRYIWVVAIFLIAVMALVQQGAVIGFSIGGRS